ncbi:MAG: hypothetical protein M9954_09090 [Cyclobacteriaceae bacterium]|nr:hypothetical protein [Cyclobacteriaceae bacterium]MCB0500369.1 hypothetical protein [Cyclobacteriaceae bacterium]MCB9238644.1 hypothetical protein [Flammeovirgaceae bacterium]MCO5271802.1 hypothetical protein [Cyclobacteriaceae bacterium]MCW5901196.1 hypothetical protein [Cyclobacteriaceae bacterium]
MVGRNLTSGIILILGGCIGTDLVDDPMVPGQLEIQPDRIALLVGSMEEASAVYTNTFGVVENVPIAWNIGPATTASVSPNGVVTAKAPGQALLSAAYSSTTDSIRVTVVANEAEVAFVDVAVSEASLSVGETATAVATSKNINGAEVTGGAVQWISTDGPVVEVDAAGTLLAKGSGVADVYAIVDGVYSLGVPIIVGGGKRVGTFQSANGYNASGMAVLEVVNGELVLTFSDDFMTSFALGTFIYLANDNVSGTTIRNEGIELGEITTNGAHTFNVTQNFPNATISQFQYVIVLCKPASIPFGYAQLN